MLIKNGKEQIYTPLFGSVAELLKHHAENFGEKEAIVAVDVDRNEEQILSYNQLSQLAYKAANFLYQKGIQKGDRIAFLFENTPDILVLELAAGLLGASSVPLDMKRDTEERKQFKMKDADVKMVFDSSSHLAALVEQRFATSVFGLNDSCENEYVLLYTSGTTANPKGVPLTLRACFANAEGIAKWQNLSPEDRFLILLPLHHVNSTIMSLATLVVGGTIILSSRYSTSKFWELVNKHRATLTSIVPTILHDLLVRKEEYFSKEYDISSLKRILIGSAPVLPEETLRFVNTFKIDVVQGYGQTETALRVTGVPIDLPRETYLEMTRTNSIGKELAYCNVTILKEDKTEAAENEEGEICIRGPALGQGYLNSPEETAKEFAGDWFHSGDLGYYRSINGEKYFFIKGRIKEIIIKGGVNISPAAVEDALLKNFSEIDEVCVVGYPDTRMGEEIAAVISLRGSSSDEQGKRLAERIVQEGGLGKLDGLPRYEAPSRVFITKQEIPKTSTGKIQRVKVKQMVQEWLSQQKTPHYYCRLVGSNEQGVLAQAVEINNKRWNVKSDIAEFRERAKNGYLIGTFDEEENLRGSLSALKTTKDKLEQASTWDEVTGQGTLSTNDPNGDILLCAAISADSREAESFSVSEPPRSLGDAVIADYLKTNLDNVIRFHRKPKGGMPKGAEVTRVYPQGRPQDTDALGYNVLVEYPEITKYTKIIRSKNAPPSVLLIEQAMLLAKEKGCKKVMAFSRPAQFKLHLAKALDNSILFEPHNGSEFSEFSKLVREHLR